MCIIIIGILFVFQQAMLFQHGKREDLLQHGRFSFDAKVFGQSLGFTRLPLNGGEIKDLTHSLPRCHKSTKNISIKSLLELNFQRLESDALFFR